jgi:ribosome-associated translation inhibitor RaiA
MASGHSGKGASSDDAYGQVGGVHVRVSGLQEEDVFTRDGVYNEIAGTLKKLTGMLVISDCTLNVKKYHETGGRKKYSVKLGIISDKGDFHADDHEWDIFKAVKLALEKLEREVFRKEGKGKVHARAP